MAKYELTGGSTAKTNLFIITEKFSNKWDIELNDSKYISAQLTPEKRSVHLALAGRVIAVVMPDRKKDKFITAEWIRQQASKVSGLLKDTGSDTIEIHNQTPDAFLSISAAEGFGLSDYRFDKYKSKKDKPVFKRILIADRKVSTADITNLTATTEANHASRDLVNEPVNRLNAEGLANAFVAMGKSSGFSVKVLKKAEIVKMKMGGLLAVNLGSIDGPTFTIMEYKPRRAKNKKPIVLVGKGVVYDTGGLSLKPTLNSMDQMKCDMAGAAAVGATMQAIAKAGLDVHVIGLVPATDNRPGGNAYAPGDVITMMDGSNVEMLNADAEGRMILADALHYAKSLKPELVIDLATLTGAAVAAIGTQASVGMGTAPEYLKKQLHESGFRVHERIAELPFWEDYDEMLKSDIASQKNVGGSYAGAITAGRFLYKFTDYPYYHLDIAGPAFLSAPEGYRTKGGSGVGVRLLFDFLKNVKFK